MRRFLLTGDVSARTCKRWTRLEHPMGPPTLWQAATPTSRHYSSSSTTELPAESEIGGTGTTSSKARSKAARIQLAGRGRLITTAYRTNTTTLAEELRPLIRDNETGKTRTFWTFGSLYWELSEDGLSIYRPLAFSIRQIADESIERITAEANTKKHHPSFAWINEDLDSSPCHLVVICTTHQPRCLSLRDVLLANAIDSILSRYNTRAPLLIPKGAKFLKATSESVLRPPDHTLLRSLWQKERQKLGKAVHDAIERDVEKVKSKIQEGGSVK